ncbi:hypothetical protein C8J56DRAFT_898513 [Mycena floridula]|nr:hypothetical protein C8J56DRAFT_898513 [Mycena floridula]
MTQFLAWTVQSPPSSLPRTFSFRPYLSLSSWEFAQGSEPPQHWVKPPTRMFPGDFKASYALFPPPNSSVDLPLRSVAAFQVQVINRCLNVGLSNIAYLTTEKSERFSIFNWQMYGTLGETALRVIQSRTPINKCPHLLLQFHGDLYKKILRPICQATGPSRFLVPSSWEIRPYFGFVPDSRLRTSLLTKLTSVQRNRLAIEVEVAAALQSLLVAEIEGFLSQLT